MCSWALHRSSCMPTQEARRDYAAKHAGVERREAGQKERDRQAGRQRDTENQWEWSAGFLTLLAPLQPIWPERLPPIPFCSPPAFEIPPICKALGRCLSREGLHSEPPSSWPQGWQESEKAHHTSLLQEAHAWGCSRPHFPLLLPGLRCSDGAGTDEKGRKGQVSAGHSRQEQGGQGHLELPRP